MSAIQPRTRSKKMQYLLMIYQNEVEYAKNDAATSQKMMDEYQTFTQSIIQSDHGARARWQDADH
jgi:hypothetical protein